VNPVRIFVGGESPYEVVVGVGAHSELPGLIGPARTVVVVHAAGLTGLAAPVGAALTEAGYLVRLAAVPGGDVFAVGASTNLVVQAGELNKGYL